MLNKKTPTESNLTNDQLSKCVIARLARETIEDSDNQSLSEKIARLYPRISDEDVSEIFTIVRSLIPSKTIVGPVQQTLL